MGQRSERGDEGAIVSVALGLRSTAQSLGWIAAEVGIFSKLGLDFRISRMETAAPVGLAGLLKREWDFVEIGAVPIVQAVLEGKDPVILLAPEQVAALFILANKNYPTPESLSGGRIGVLSQSGQTGMSAALMLHRWGLDGRVELAPLGTYPAIYESLAKGDVAAGVLTADYRFHGQRAHGFQALVDLGRTFEFQGPVVASTRRAVRECRDQVSQVVRGYVEAIRYFKSEREAVLPLLGRHLGIDDRAVLAAICDFYAPRFQFVPAPSTSGIAKVIDEFTESHRRAAGMRPEHVMDLSFLNDICGR